MTSAVDGAPADLSNWRTAPHSAWAFSHVDAVLPTAVIAHDPARVTPLVSSSRALDDVALAVHDGSSLRLSEMLARTATDAFVALVDGEVAVERYFNGASALQPHIAMSASKAMSGLLAGILAASGDLDLEAQVADYVPEVAHTGYAGATLRHLLDMRTGVRLDEVQAERYELASNWQPYPREAAGFGLHAFLGELPPAHLPHGGPFQYISPNTDLLGWAFERATGRTVAELMSERLWKPMGAEAAASITLDRQGAARCTGGLCATARDLARIGLLMLDDGRIGDRQVLPEGLVQDIRLGGDPAVWADGEWGRAFSFISPRMRYRSGWYMVDDAPQTLFAMGIHGQNIFIDPPRRTVIVKLSSLGATIDYAALPLTHAVMPQISRALAG